MLIDFTFNNFLSYKKENRLLMTSVKSFKELQAENLIETDTGLSLMKSIAIYGSNGGGKSNFIAAMGFMDGLVHNSFGDSLRKEEDKETRDIQFKLCTETEHQPSKFQVTFIADNTIYRYGFEILGEKIIEEWLYKKVNTETMLFIRKGNSFKINKKGFSEGSKHKDEVNENVLFLSHLAQYNGPISKPIFAWFRDTNVVSGLDNTHHSNVTNILLREDPKFKLWLSKAVQFLEISKVEPGEKNDDIITYHNKFDNNNIIVDSVPFNISKEESQGTRKLIYLLGAFYDTLVEGKVLFIDELDSKLHPNLSKKLMSFFHSFNRNGAQFIFTAHDASLLDKDVFRRDQIWFSDRDQFGVSEIYPMSSFDTSVVKNTSDFRKKYLSSTFGGAETMEITNSLISMMYE